MIKANDWYAYKNLVRRIIIYGYIRTKQFKPLKKEKNRLIKVKEDVEIFPFSNVSWVGNIDRERQPQFPGTSGNLERIDHVFYTRFKPNDSHFKAKYRTSRQKTCACGLPSKVVKIATGAVFGR